MPNTPKAAGCHERVELGLWAGLEAAGRVRPGLVIVYGVCVTVTGVRLLDGDLPHTGGDGGAQIECAFGPPVLPQQQPNVFRMRRAQPEADARDNRNRAEERLVRSSPPRRRSSQGHSNSDNPVSGIRTQSGRLFSS